MEIVDGQVHVGAGGIEAMLAAMDTLGISAVLIDEYWGRSAPSDWSHFEPGYLLPNGAWRPVCPVAEQAGLLHPERIAYLLRVERRDPELAGLLRLLSSSPNARAIRIMPVGTQAEADAFAAGAYDELFELAQALSLPIFLFIPGQVELLHGPAARFPRATFIVDHCGMPSSNGFSRAAAKTEAQKAGGLRYFEEVLSLAQHPNVALKWSHAQERFQAHDYPYAPLRPLLRRAIDAFGAERVVWASDHSVLPAYSWGELLFSLRDDPELAPTEKEWLLGRAVRTLLNWPAPVSAG
jgi:predicted TIM-barrel fold metal-dependent hydrolase